MSTASQTERIHRRAEALLAENRFTVARETDRLFGWLLVAEWVAGIGLALGYSPLAWEGRESTLHPNLLGATLTGALLISLPVFLSVRNAGDLLTRHVLVAAQAIMTGHIVHLTGGRVETHFLYFGALAFASFYRDWRVLLTFSAIAGLHHMVGSYLIPLSMYGVQGGVEWRWVEHVAWVLFEGAFLTVACVRWQREMAEVARRQAQLEVVNEGIELEILKPLGESAQELAGSADRLVAQMDAQRSAVMQQASALQQAHVTAQEIRQTSQAASRLAKGALEMATDADTRGRNGEQALSAGLEDFGLIQTRVLAIANDIRSLQEQTRRVESITDTVKDLADRSNMLALNAAIEAVRSGEHGKGFAIVAREIRTLADQSIVATREVRQVLDTMGNAVQTTAESGELGASAIEQGLEQVRGSGESLRELAEALSHMSRSVRQISATVSQQSVGVDEIFTVITRLQEVMDETRQRLEETDGAVATVSKAADAVHSVVRIAGTYRSA